MTIPIAPTQKLLIPGIISSGKRVSKTIPAAKRPTATLVKTYEIRLTTDKKPPSGWRIAAFEEFRHRKDEAPGVEWNENPAQNEQAPGVQFVVGHGDAVLGTRPGKTDEVFGADIRGETATLR